MEAMQICHQTEWREGTYSVLADSTVVGKLPGLTQLLSEDSHWESHRNSSVLPAGVQLLRV